MQGTFPIKAEEFNWKKIANTYVLMDKNTKEMHKLDPVSFLTWIQCDGKTSIEEIVDVFSVGGNRDIIHAAIKGVLEKMTTSGVIKWA